MRKTLAAAFCVLILIPILRAEEEAAPKPKFESTAAKEAVAKHEERLDFLNAKLQEQVETARGEFRTDLQKALEVAVDDKDFSEARRISAFLESTAQPIAEPKLTKEISSEVVVLRKRIQDLQSQLAAAKRVDPIVGKWDYHNGNVCDYTPDGWVVLKGTRIGLWNRTEDRRYVVAFLKNFASGTSDVLEMQNERTILSTAKNGDKFGIDRVDR